MVLPLHRACFSWSTGTHLDLEWSKGSGKPLLILPAAPQLAIAEEETSPDEHTKRGIPALCWREDSPVLFERFQLRENTEYLVDVTLPKSLSDLKKGAPYPKGWPFNERLATVFRIDPPRRWRENGDEFEGTYNRSSGTSVERGSSRPVKTSFPSRSTSISTYVVAATNSRKYST